MGENEFLCARKANVTETAYENGLTLMTKENIFFCFEMYTSQGGLSELVKQGRRLGEQWGVKMTAQELSRLFSTQLKSVLLPRTRITCMFMDTGLRFTGRNSDQDIKLVTELLTATLEKARDSERYRSLCDKRKAASLASITGSFWLPFLTALAPMGTHNLNVAYTLSAQRLEVFEPDNGTAPQNKVQKHFHTPDAKKWTDTATAMQDGRSLCLLLGPRKAGKKAKVADEDETEGDEERWEPRERTVRDLTLENDWYRDRLAEYKVKVGDQRNIIHCQRAQLEGTQAELEDTQAQLEDTQAQLEGVQARLEGVQAQLEEVRAQLEEVQALKKRSRKRKEVSE